MSRESQLAEFAQQFKEALYSDPINEELIEGLLSQTTNEDRQIIRSAYHQLYEYPIQNDIKAKLKGDLKNLAIDMFDTPAEYDARVLHKAITSFISNTDVINEIFSTRPQSHLEMVDQAYQKFYNTSLKDDIQKELKDKYAEYLLEIMNTPRAKDQTISGNDAKNNAELLQEKGLKEFAKDTELFKKVFLEKSREDLILIARSFNEKFGKDLYKAIEQDVNGKSEDLLKSILFGVITPAEMFAEKINGALKSISKDKETLNRILVGRNEIDMYAIKDYYSTLYSTDMTNDIVNFIGGTYGNILRNLSQQ